MTRRLALIAALACLALPAAALAAEAARESLGVYSDWAAFRDESPRRCYAIARPRAASEAQPFASVATWPDQNIRGQLHIRLSRRIAKGSAVSLTIGARRFDLTASERDAWAQDPGMDAAIAAAMRSNSAMRVRARAAGAGYFTDRYSLDGAATAMDAAVVGCAKA